MSDGVNRTFVEVNIFVEQAWFKKLSSKIYVLASFSFILDQFTEKNDN